MLRAGAGLSDLRDPRAAVAAAMQDALAQLGGDQAALVLLFATAHHAPEQLLAGAWNLVSAAPIVGCTGAGVLTGAGEIEQSPGVAVLAVAGDALRALPFLLPAEPDETHLGQAIVRAVGGQIEPGALLMLLPDMLSLSPVELLGELSGPLDGLPIVGGAPSGAPLSQTGALWCGDAIARSGVVGLLLNGAIAARVGVAQGCTPFAQPLTITRAAGHIVHEIAFRPALEVLREAVTSLPVDEARRAQSVFAGLAIDDRKETLQRGDFLVRNLLGADPRSGVLGVAEEVRPGQVIQFNLRDARSAHEDLESMLADLKALVGERPPAFGLYFNCLGRGQGLFGEPDHDVRLIRAVLGDVPLAGFFGNAELAPVQRRNHLHNYTGVLVLVGEE